MSKLMKESLESTVFSGIQSLDIKSSFLSLNCFSWQATGTSSGNKNRKKEKEKEDASLWDRNRRNPSYNLKSHTVVIFAVNAVNLRQLTLNSSQHSITKTTNYGTPSVGKWI